MIQLDPRHVRLSPGSGKSIQRRRKDDTSTDNDPVVIPIKAHVNYIPGPDSLRTLINSAVNALKKGVRWDRGTILNILS